MLTPEEIQSREFLVSLRGYDRDEVHAFLGRVAEQLAQTEAKASQLQQRLDRLKAQQPSSAALAEPAPAAQSSSPEPSAMFAEIGKETQRILEAAQEAGQQIQRKARQEADRDLQSARGQAAKLIAEGERRREHIERIVTELEQARAAMSVQLRGVGRTIDQTLRELAPEDQGGTAGGTSTVREAIGSQATSGSVAAPAASSPAASAPASTSPSRAASAAAPAPSQDEAEPTEAAEPAAADVGELAAPAASEAPAATPAVDEPPAADDTAAEDEFPAAVDTPAADDASAADDATAVEETATEAADEPAAPAPAATDENADAAPQAPVIAPDEGADDAPAAAAPAATEDNEPPAAATATPPAETATAAAATEPAMPPARQTDDDEQPDAQALRAAALSPLHPKLVRKVKRELQEIQNIALDKVRRAKGQGNVDDFLPSEEDTAGLGEGAGDLLRQAWDAGVASAAVLAGADLNGGGDAPDLAGTFLGDAAERVRSGLSSTLRMGLTADEGQQALSDRIGAVFAEFKGAQAEELAATHLIRAYEFGLLGAWSEGGITARRWVMGREPRCPEAKCRSNDQSGAVAVADAFPSGHEVPPVHVGCTCTTVPEPLA